MRHLRLLCFALALRASGPASATTPAPPEKLAVVITAAFSPDRRLVLAGYDDGGTGREPLLRLWDFETGKLVRTFPGHREAVPYVAFTPDGKLAVSVCPWDDAAHLWDVATGREVRRFDAPRFGGFPAALSPDGKSLLAGVADKENKRYEFRLWEVGTGKFKRFDTRIGLIYQIKFAPDGKLALLECQRTLSDPGGFRLFDPSTGKEVPAPGLADRKCIPVAFVGSSKRLLIEETDWAPERPKSLSHLSVWDVATDKVVRSLPPRRPGTSEYPFSTRGFARLTAFSPDGKQVATADQDGMLRLWDLATGKEVWSETADSQAVAFSQDGKRVLSLTAILVPRAGRFQRFQGRDAATGELVHDVPLQR